MMTVTYRLGLSHGRNIFAGIVGHREINHAPRFTTHYITGHVKLLKCGMALTADPWTVLWFIPMGTFVP